MRHASCVLGLLLLASPSFAALSPHFPSAPRTPFEAGEVLVALAPDASVGMAANGRMRASSTALAATLDRFGLARADVLNRADSPARGDIVRLRSSDAAFDPVAAAAALRATPGVIGASPNIHLHLDRAPNDPYFPSQWHLSNSAAAPHAQQGWDRQTGKSSIIIAILDTGVDLTHADLYANIWTNPGEIDGNSIDDDHDGYQDDVHGWDFGDNDNDPDPDPLIDPSYGIDEGWHGTFVAGLAAGVGNNGLGISGVAWGCQIMPLKISDANGNMTLSAAVQAIAYAAAHHASVINMSFGTTDPSAASIFQPAIYSAVAAGTACVASAGNMGTDTAEYPAACESTVAVASTNASNVRSSWSNWGWYVDIAAPGEGMWSTIARNYAYDDYSVQAFEQWWGFDGMHAYMENDGTSFSAPLVSGTIALICSQFPWINGRGAQWQVLLDGESHVYDNPIGPKLNIDRSLTFALAVEPSAPVSKLGFAPPSPNPAAASTALRWQMPRAGRARLALYDAAGRLVRVLADGDVAAGPQSLAWDLRDDAGHAVGAGLYFARLDAGAERATQRIAVVR
jgi:subtilisin family serine protease